jgi:hypothetical protein
MLLGIATLSTVAIILFFTLNPNSQRLHDGGSATNYTMNGDDDDPTDWMDWIRGGSPSSLESNNKAMLVESPTAMTMMERFALVVVFSETTNGETSWNDRLNFLDSNLSVCDWNDGDKHGVFCDDDRRTVKQLLLGT